MSDFPSAGSLPSSVIETSNRGTSGVAAFIQDQTTPVLTVPFLQERAVVTLANDTAIGDRIVNLEPGHGTLVGEVLELGVTGASQFMQAKVLVVNVNAITIDQPVNQVYTVAATSAVRSSDDLRVNGAATPQVFSILPLPGQIGDMVRVIVSITGTSSMDFETLGSIAGLLNGCVIRVKNQDGTFRNILNFKNNGDFIRQGLDHSFLLNNGGGVRAFIARVTWGGQSKHGVVIRLDGSLDEELQIVIQDALTSATNTSFTLQAQGHETQD